MTDQEREKAELARDRKKWVVRRRMAISAFACNVVLVAFYLIAPLFVSVDQATAMSEFNGIVIAIIGFFSSIDMVYIGAATYADKASKVTTPLD